MSVLRKGFTLIELIVVIVIIGILAAVAAVAYNSFIANANTAAAVAEATDAANMIQANAALANAVPVYTYDAGPPVVGVRAVKGACTVTATIKTAGEVGSGYTLVKTGCA